MLYIGRKGANGPLYVKNDDGFEREFPGLSKQAFYDMLRRECGLPATMADREVWAEAQMNFRATPTGFVRDEP